MAGTPIADLFAQIRPDMSGFASEMNAEARKIGPISIAVNPELAKDFQAQMQRSVDRMSLTIKAEIDGSYLANAAESTVKNLNRSGALPALVIKAEADNESAKNAGNEITRLAQKASSSVNLNSAADDSSAKSAGNEATRLAERAAGEINLDSEADNSSARSAGNEATRIAQRAAGDIKLKVDVDKSSTNALSGLFSGLSGGGSSLASFGLTVSGALSALKVAGLALSPVLVGVASSAALAGASIAAVGPAAIGAGQALGAVKLAFSGVLAALKDADAADTASVPKAQANSAAKIASAIALRNAQQAVSAAMADQVKKVDLVTPAMNALKSSETSLASAQQSALKAQQAINQAREDAVQDLKDMQRSLLDLTDNETDAGIAVERAQENLTKVNKDATSTDLDRREAAQQLLESQHRLAEIQDDQTAKAKELADAQKKGVDGSQKVIDANDSYKDALDKVTQAQKDEKKAEADVAQARIEQAKENAAAQKAHDDAVAKANQNLRDIQAQQAAAAKDAAANSAQLSSSSSKLQKDLAALSPTALALYEKIRSLSGEFTTFKQAMETATLPGFTKFLGDISEKGKDGKTVIDLLRDSTAGYGSIISDTVGKLGDFVKSPAFAKDFGTITKNGQEAFKNLSDAILAVVPAFSKIFAAASPILIQLSGYVKDLADKFATFIDNADKNGTLVKFFHDAGTELGKWWGIAKDLGGILLGIFKASLPGGSDLVTRLGELTHNISEWVNSKDGQEKIKEFFDFFANINWEVIGKGLLGIAAGVVAIKTALAVVNGAQGVAGLIEGLVGLGPVGIIIGGVAAAVGLLAAGFVVLYEKVKPFRDFINETVVAGFKNLVDYFKTTVLPALKNAAGILLDDLKPALERLKQTWEDNKGPILVVLGVVKDLVTYFLMHMLPVLADLEGKYLAGVIDAFGFLFKLLSNGIVAASDFELGFVKAFQDVANFFLTFAGDFLKAADIAFGWIPGIGPKIDAANKNFQDFSTKAKSTMDGIVSGSQTVNDALHDSLEKPRSDAAFTAAGKAFADGVQIPVTDFFGKDMPANWASNTANANSSWTSVGASLGTNLIDITNGLFGTTLPTGWTNNTTNAGNSWAAAGASLGTGLGSIANTLFGTTLPTGWSNNTSNAGSSWTSAGASLGTGLGAIASTLFGTTLPAGWANNTSNASSSWVSAGTSLGRDLGSLAGTLFNTTLPTGWANNTSNASSSWKSSGGAFTTSLDNPLTTWFTKTLPGHINLIPGFLGGAFKGAWATANTESSKGIAQTLRYVQSGVNAINAIIPDKKNYIGIGVDLGKAILDLGSSLKLATGGFVSGSGTSTSDSIPARLSNGEFVMKADSVQQYGVPFMKALNNGEVAAHLASGGSVDEIIKVARSSGIPLGSIITTQGKHATDSYHYKSEAVDFGGEGGTGKVGGITDQLAAWFYKNYGSHLLEEIHTKADNSGGWYIKNGRSVNGIATYGASTVAEHKDHTHIAAAPGFSSGASGFLGDGTGGGGGGGVDLLAAGIANLKKAAAPALASLSGSDYPSSLGRYGLTQALNWAVDQAPNWWSDLSGSGGGVSGNADVVKTALATASSLGADNKVMLALIEAGIVESGLKNLNYGDQDSIGFLQQRPSQGWPDPMNVATATRSFVNAAKKIESNYATSGALAQGVQRSAYPAKYGQQKSAALAVLASNGISIPANLYDSGGAWPTGTLGYNNTGKTEFVRTNEQESALRNGEMSLDNYTLQKLAMYLSSRPAELYVDGKKMAESENTRMGRLLTNGVI